MSASTCLKSTKIHALVANSSPEEPAITRILSPTTKPQPISISRRAIDLEGNGIAQYEISNFARPGSESRHNLKYWTRQPYLGFGVDAHSMLVSSSPGENAVRFSTARCPRKICCRLPLQKTVVPRANALEELFFLGLRLNRGVDLREVAAAFGQQALDRLALSIAELITDGLLQRDGDRVRLTSRGRLLSNEVFQTFLAPSPAPTSI